MGRRVADILQLSQNQSGWKRLLSPACDPTPAHQTMALSAMSTDSDSTTSLGLPRSNHPSCEEILPHVQPRHPWLQLKAVSCHPIPGAWGERLPHGYSLLSGRKWFILEIKYILDKQLEPSYQYIVIIFLFLFGSNQKPWFLAMNDPNHNRRCF